MNETARTLQEFVEDLSNWYVRRCRDRFWAKGMEQDKVNAYMTLYTCLETFCRTAAPMIPFMTEEIYLNIVKGVDKNAPDSIHLCDYPAANDAFIDKELEADMDHALKLVVMGRACRNAAARKNRQPLANMIVKAPFCLSAFYDDIITDELNIKKITYMDDVREYTSYSFKPEMHTVGPKYGRLMGKITKALQELDGNTAMDSLKADGVLRLMIDGQEVELTEENLLITVTQKEGFMSDSNGDVTVVLDCNLTEELLAEGFMREVVSKIQTMRKEAGFEVTDHITVYHRDSEKIAQILEAFAEEIKAGVLADEVIEGEPEGYVKEWKINGEAVVLGVKK